MNIEIDGETYDVDPFTVDEFEYIIAGDTEYEQLLRAAVCSGMMSERPKGVNE